MRLVEPTRRTLLEAGYRLGGWPRRAAALLCLTLAGLGAVQAHGRSGSNRVVPVLVAARDLAAGTALRAADVSIARWDPDTVPPLALHALGRPGRLITAGAINRGEPITPARLQGAGIAVGLPVGLVAVTVTITGPNATTLIRAGDRVDLLAATPSDTNATRSARVVASGSRVLAVLASNPADADDAGTGLVVAVSRSTALALASVVDGSMTATLRVPP